jgi:hypothetical protein
MHIFGEKCPFGGVAGTGSVRWDSKTVPNFGMGEKFQENS